MYLAELIEKLSHLAENEARDLPVLVNGRSISQVCVVIRRYPDGGVTEQVEVTLS